MSDRADDPEPTSEPTPAPKTPRARSTARPKSSSTATSGAAAPAARMSRSTPTEVPGSPTATAAEDRQGDCHQRPLTPTMDAPARDTGTATTPATAPTAGAVLASPASDLDRDLVGQGLDDVTTGTLRIQQGGVNNVNATNVDVVQGGIGRAQATDIAVSQGGIALAQGDKISLEMGGMALAIGREVRIVQGGAQNVFARDAHIEQAAVWSMAAGSVTFQRGGAVGILLARRVDGDVRVLLDWRGALAAGAVIGLLLGILRRR
jgi:hypothetical protein